MADNTIVQSGTFISDGAARTLVLRSDIDWIQVFNETEATATNINRGYKYFWRRGLANGGGFVEYHPAADHTAAINVLAANTGISLIDSSTMVPGAAVAVTAGTNATQPVYSTAATGLLAAGAIARVVNTAHTNVNGLDFTVDTVVANTSFRLANALQQAPGLIAGANGFYRFIAPDIDTYKLFYPSKRVIGNITAANPGVVTTLVDHGLTTGQRVRLSVPGVCGMVQLDGREVNVTVLSASTFSIGVDTTAMTAFAFPLPASVPFTPAEMIPVGTRAGGPLADATINQGFIGVRLAAGVLSPAGSNNDVISWIAGKSFNL